MPNTLNPSLGGLDWACIPGMFEGCLAPSSKVTRAPYIKVSPDIDAKTLETDTDVALSNLEGDGTLVIAERWADKGKLRRKLEIMQQYLQGSELRTVEGILHGQVYEGNECSSDVEDIWETRVKTHDQGSKSKATTTKALSKPQAQPKQQEDRGTGAKASHAETSAALARLRAPVRRRSYMDSDEETEYHEEAHTEAAEYFFSNLRDHQFNAPSSPFPYLSSPSQKENHSSSSKKQSQTSERTPLGTTVRTPQGLLTPRSRQVSQEMPQTNPVSLLTPLMQFPRMRSQDSMPRTPPPSRTTTLGSPIKLRSDHSSSQSSASKPRSLAPPLVQSRAERSSQVHGPSTRASGETAAYHFESIQNLGKRPAEVIPVNLATPKRKKIDQESKPSSKKVDSETSCTRDIVPSKSIAMFASDTRVLGTATQVTTITKTVQASSSRKLLSQEESQTRRDARYELAERLSQACPDLAGPNFKRKLERHKSQKLSQGIARPMPPQQTKTEALITLEKIQLSTAVPSREKDCHSVSLMFPTVEDDVIVDPERVARLANAFKAQFAKGIRPGLVVPRLACLESQEED